jgi:lipopolysaccharide export system protein LptA
LFLFPVPFKIRNYANSYEKSYTTELLWCASAVISGILLALALNAPQNLERSNNAIEPAIVALDRSSPKTKHFQQHRLLITQQRDGETRQFKIPVFLTPKPEERNIPVDRVEVIEVIADRQEYDEPRQVITAEGNVTMRFADSVMICDRIEINLADRIAVARGNVVLQRGEQILRGEKFEYYLVQDRGVVYNANGEIDRTSLSQPDTSSTELVPATPLSDRLANNAPREVTATQGTEIQVGSSRRIDVLEDNQPQVRNGEGKLRFRAEKIDFEAKTWQASQLRLTNDPFSPPELEVVADTATFVQSDRDVSRLKTKKSRVVIDRRVAVPLLVSQFTFDNRPQNPGLFNIGFDGEERGGLYLERSFTLIDRDRITWQVTPQYFLQRALIPTAFGFSKKEDGGIIDPATFGLTSQFNAEISARTNLQTAISITGFNTGSLADELRTKVTVDRLLGKLDNPHIVSLQYNFRERLFNGSLGFQTVRSSVGGIITSPDISLGKTGINFKYQGSIQNINADTDRTELLAVDRDNDRINLTRYQVAAFFDKSFNLWQGKPLAATKTGGLRYTPVPVVPYLQLVTGISGVGSFYSNNDTQASLRGNIGIRGQLGHFSRSYLDYTGFNVTYSQSIRGEESPFLFDRDVDRQTISLGLTQQLYGPIRVGIQTSFNLDNDDEISTDYIIEYSRRTYNLILRYNPVLEIGSFGLRINDFNWRGNAQPLQQNEIAPVIQGVR